MGKVRERHEVYKKAGFDLGPRGGGSQFVNGPLTPAVIDALSKLKDLLTVEGVMESQDRKLWIQLEIPDTFEAAFIKALEGSKP